MTKRDPSLDDEAVAGAFAEVAQARRPSRFETARAARDLDLAIDGLEARRRRIWRPGVVAAAVALAGAVGVVTGVALSSQRTAGGGGEVAVRDAAPVPAPGAPAAALSSAPSMAATAGASIPESMVAPSLAEGTPVAEAPRAPLAASRRSDAGWRAAVASLSAAGDDRGAARVLAAALLTDDAAAAPLMATLRRAPAAAAEVDAALMGSRHAEAMRVRCEVGLLYRRDRAALDACRAFAQQWPEHPGARVLSFAAGRVAEDELGDLAAAEAEYGRAMLLAPLAGLPSTDALLARARVRAARGVLDEARADLRLYLHQEPAAAADPGVRALMVGLAIEPPR